jgi:hypothetical protein
MVSGLLMQGVSTAGIALGVNKTLLSPDDAEALGLTAAYDTTNTTLVRYHIDEFFALNPDGELVIRLVSRTTTMAQMLAADGPAQVMLVEAEGRIRQLGVALNPAITYVPVVTNAIDDDCEDSIPLAQVLADSEFAAHRPVEIVIEGRSFTGTAGAAPTLRGTGATAYPNVTVVIAQDTEVATSGVRAAHAAVGTALGTVSKARVHENIGWVARFNLQRPGKWLKPGLSNNALISSYNGSAQTALHTKGYLFVRTFTGYPGCFWVDSPTCVELASDYAYIENNRTIGKATRIIYSGLLAFTNGPVRLKDGKLDPDYVADLEGRGRAALAGMYADGEISEPADVYVDPNQDVLATSNIDVKFSLVPYGSSRNVNGSVGFTDFIA